ncbi:MAG TPA: DUF2079 domain-containing protein [Chthoniobacterales bacterium]|jgi:uncharacterized membrane protein|nr:DUF2079 domain-containing protein [Chthoniobacterales bacterium]
MALAIALVVFVGWTWTSYVHWANFEYRTFDLAFYVQGTWQLLQGRFNVSVLGVPLLGNHVEPIVFLILPVFFLFRHPMVFVVVQNLALAAMGPLAYRSARQLRLSRTSSLLLASALLLAPATGYVALHEFHPEALAAPFVLLMIHARLGGRLGVYWLAIIGLLACKENMALLVAAYCALHLFLERKHAASALRRWYLWPLAGSIIWFALCAKVISPALNPGEIDYLALYNRLGGSAGEIVLNAITEPQRIVGALRESLGNGNLFWGLLLPFLGLPLLRPRWLLIASPILLQHLLSWRSSEWQIYFHYAAPLIPLFWIALAQVAARIENSAVVPNRLSGTVPFLTAGACLAAQFLLGPAASIGSSLVEWTTGGPDRARKLSLIDQIPAGASVVAPLPYLSHLAMREELFSLHFILKGLKTLSRGEYRPPHRTDFVLIDYDDSATFDSGAGYYHPAMKTVDNRVIPSSDRLLHDFLKRSSWAITSSNELTVFRNGTASPEIATGVTRSAGPVVIDQHTTLNEIRLTTDVLSDAGLEIAMNWSFQDERVLFPWMLLRLMPQNGGAAITISRGLCSPERSGGEHIEKWQVTLSSRLQPGDYEAEALFVDYARLLWAEKVPGRNNPTVSSLARVPLGPIRIQRRESAEN